MTNTNKIELGTLIHGTLRNEDLLQAFASELYRLAGGTGEGDQPQGIINEAMDLLDNASEEKFEEFASEIVYDLMDALNEYAPTGYYFGAIEGDGSDFGFWTDEDPDEDIATGKCNQCDSATINGVYCHEQGCPNS